MLPPVMCFFFSAFFVHNTQLPKKVVLFFLAGGLQDGSKKDSV
jgi:hypothetical protein